MWERLLLIAAGGALGALARYAAGSAIADRLGPTVLGTFIVNVSGAFVLGMFLGLTEGRWIAPPLARPAIAIGFLGAYTTFSTLAFETVDLAESGSLFAAFANIAGSAAAGLLAVYSGLVIGRNV
jgi:CrcB protein